MKPPKILVAEDEKFILKIITRILEADGFEVIPAHNGQEALEKLHDVFPDLILSDIMMPEMDGFQLLQSIKSEKRFDSVPFVFLSAKSQIQDIVKGLEMGADDYICKPFNDQELLARIKTRLKKKDESTTLDFRDSQPIKGDLSIISVINLIQMLRQRKITGKIILTMGDEKAFLRLNQGELVDIEYGQSDHFKAFRLLIDRREGSFTFSASVAPFEKKITMNTQKFILESIRQEDEIKEKSVAVKTQIKQMIDSKGGDIALIVLGMDQDSIKVFIFALSDCLGAPKETSESSGEAIKYKKITLNTGYCLNIYGTTEYQKFSFMGKILEQEIWGIVILLDTPDFFNQEYMVEFLKKIETEKHIPCQLVLRTDTSAAGEIEEKLKNTKITKAEDVFFCDFRDEKSVLAVLQALLEKNRNL